MPRKLNDLTGKRFGRWLVVERSANGARSAPYWDVLCDCGQRRRVRGSSLTCNGSRSCGCLAAELSAGRERIHGEGVKQSPEYRAWWIMRQRCNNPRRETFPNYGGRGIAVCDRWNEYANFLTDMGRKPSAAHSLDRIDNNGPYSPENCRWATWTEQANNRRVASSAHFVTAYGLRLRITDWARAFGVNLATIRSRLRRGCPPERAVGFPRIEFAA